MPMRGGLGDGSRHGTAGASFPPGPAPPCKPHPCTLPQCGSCVAFANVAALEAAFILQYSFMGFNNMNVDLSEQDHMDCYPGGSAAHVAKG